MKEGPVSGNTFHGRVKDIEKEKTGFRRIFLGEKLIRIDYNKLDYLKKKKN